MERLPNYLYSLFVCSLLIIPSLSFAQQNLALTAPASPNANNFIWPLTGNNHRVAYYVDHQSGGGTQDYNCGNLTYNNHNGTDITLYNFYSMDEGVPVIVSADGQVSKRKDGEFDRNTSRGGGGFGNHVEVTHADGYVSTYAHMRKNSVTVSIGQNVQAGDTLGFVGSSGNSEGPHLHFEVKVNSGLVDPFQGDCYSRASSWISQPAYATNTDFETLQYGITTIGLDQLSERPPTKIHFTAGETFYGWILVGSSPSSDVLSAKIYRNNSVWNQVNLIAQSAGALKWGYYSWTLPSGINSSENWHIEYHRNGSEIARDNFTVDGQANQAPVVASNTLVVPVDGSLSRTFEANDSDGSEMFWFTVTDEPDHGTLEVWGGRRKRFVYTPDAGYKGADQVSFYATDDSDRDGAAGTWTFDVGGTNPGTNPEDVVNLTTFPNPFINTLSMSWYSEQQSETKVSLFDATGRRVKVLFEGSVSAGDQNRTWTITDLPAGVYFCQLVQGGVQVTKPVLHLIR